MTSEVGEEVIEVDDEIIEEANQQNEQQPVEDDSNALEATQGDSNSTCMICMEEWTIGSSHRLCCLKCGHLFGRSCIERWIKEKTTNAKCPSCNKPAKKSDIRDLWCKTVRATDETTITELQGTIEEQLRKQKSDAAVIFHQNMKLELLYKEVDELKKKYKLEKEKCSRYEAILNKINRVRAERLYAQNGDNSERMDLAELDSIDPCDIEIEPQELKGSFHFAEKIESSPTGGCKTFVLCPISCLIFVAQPNPHGSRNVFSGFGLRKYSTVDFNIREFIPLHSKPINSAQLKPIGDLVLTCSQDKRVKITSINNKACIHSYICDNEPTAAAWSTHRDQQFYVASGNCFVTLYDMRNTSEYIYQTPQKVANTRLLSATALTGSDNLNGLLVNDAKGSQFLEVSPESTYETGSIDASLQHLTSHQLPFDGLMGTVDFNQKLDLALITTRKSSMSQNTSHNLLKLRKVQTGDDSHPERVDCQLVKTFMGGKSSELLSQSRILRHPTLPDSALIGASDPEACGIKLWDCSDNSVYQTIRTGTFVRDMIVYTPEATNQHTLYTLTDKGLCVYRWDYA